MVRKRCKHCRTLFCPSPRNPNQKYCSDPECQKARKRDWQRKKMQEDEAYRLNQKDAQERWAAKRPDYWRNYREEHPEYTRRNREQQQRRNRINRAVVSISKQIAKMDASPAKEHDISGYYGLVTLQDLLIAKMDAKIIKITEVSDNYDQVCADCKERTR